MSTLQSPIHCAPALNTDALLHIHESLRATFVSLPSDASMPFTAEQLLAVFPHPEVWRDVMALVIKQSLVQPETQQ